MRRVPLRSACAPLLRGSPRRRRRHGSPGAGREQRRPRPKTKPARWADALAELRALQTEYQAWRAIICPTPWPDSRTAELLEEICDIDLDALDVELPRGFGRDEHCGPRGPALPGSDNGAYVNFRGACPGAGRASSRKRQKGLARRICSEVSGSAPTTVYRRSSTREREPAARRPAAGGVEGEGREGRRGCRSRRRVRGRHRQGGRPRPRRRCR